MPNGTLCLLNFVHRKELSHTWDSPIYKHDICDFKAVDNRGGANLIDFR